LGGVLGYSTATYNNSESKYAGIIEVIEQAGKKLYSLTLNTEDPADITKLDVATFKVQDNTVAHGASIPPGG
jgi:hypothetical protein